MSSFLEILYYLQKRMMNVLRRAYFTTAAVAVPFTCPAAEKAVLQRYVRELCAVSSNKTSTI